VFFPPHEVPLACIEPTRVERQATFGGGWSYRVDRNVLGGPLAANGLPFGLQVTAPHWFEAQLLSLADEWQRIHPWARCAPGYTPLDEALGL
jgi:hypothetical protein